MHYVYILLVIVALAAGLWWFTTQYPSYAPALVTDTEDLTYSETTDLFSIKVTYPAVQNQDAQARIDAIVDEEVAHFKAQSVAPITAEEAERLREQGRPYELTIEYTAHQAEAFSSYVFTVYLDTGGAHPNTFFRTVTFNAIGKEQTLEDLFVEGAPYLPQLSEEVYPRVVAELKARTGGAVTPDMEDGVRLGTASSLEALQFFYLEDNTLHLLFPPYQVAAYAAGSFDVAIPFANIQDILKPELK